MNLVPAIALRQLASENMTKSWCVLHMSSSGAYEVGLLAKKLREFFCKECACVMLRMNEELAAAVAKGATTDMVRQLALEGGMKTLLGYSLDLVREGHTTLEEVGRMVLTDAGLESERRARALSSLTCTGCGGGLQEGWLECPYCLTPRH